MNNGFSLLEFMVAMTITLMLLTLIVGQTSLIGQRSVRIISSQERIEALFNTVDFFKSDVGACGKRLQEAQLLIPSLCYQTAPHQLTVRQGSACETLSDAVPAGSPCLYIQAVESYSSGKDLLIYDPATASSEWLRIKEKNRHMLLFESALKNDYGAGSRLIVIKTTSYQHDPGKQTLSRKVDRSPAQPMLEEVKDFYFSIYPEQASLLYQLELCSGEQVRGYISLNNLVQP